MKHTYHLKIPKKQEELYSQYVLRKIYEFSDADLWFINKVAQETSIIELIKETEDTYHIRFKWPVRISLCNVLPKTILAPDKVFFTDPVVLEYAKNRIADKISIEFTNVGQCDDTKIKFDIKSVLNLVKQLANNDIIQKYFPFDHDGYFICAAQNVPIIIGVVPEYKPEFLYIDSCPLPFDIQNGFIGCTACSKLTNYYSVWRKKGDITAEIFPPNDLNM